MTSPLLVIAMSRISAAVKTANPCLKCGERFDIHRRDLAYGWGEEFIVGCREHSEIRVTARPHVEDDLAGFYFKVADILLDHIRTWNLNNEPITAGTA